MKYSVIVPVYNAEHTIERCMDSLLGQAHDGVEILLINDGSTDNSGTLCRAYAQADPCVRYFEKENGGVSSARNIGLDHALGEYVLFVDSDDYVTEDYWETIDRLVGQYDPDMLQFGLREQGTTVRDRDIGTFSACGEREVADKINQAMRGAIFNNLQNRVFRRSMIEDAQLRFDCDLAIGEDLAFVFAYATKMMSYMSVSQVLYVLVIDNQESLSRKRRDYLAEQLMKVNRSMLNSLACSSLAPETKRVLGGAVAWLYYRSVYSSCKELLKYDLPRAERWKRIRTICREYSVGEVRPVGMRCVVIALPVIFRLSPVIDVLIHRA